MMAALRDECRKMIREELQRALQQLRGKVKLQSYEAPARIAEPADVEVVENLDVLQDLKWLAPALDELEGQ